jgi:hypothetical protein
MKPLSTKGRRVFLSERGLRSLKPGVMVNLQSSMTSARFHSVVGRFKNLEETNGEITALVIEDDGLIITFPREKLFFIQRFQ